MTVAVDPASIPRKRLAAEGVAYLGVAAAWGAAGSEAIVVGSDMSSLRAAWARLSHNPLDESATYSVLVFRQEDTRTPVEQA